MLYSNSNFILTIQSTFDMLTKNPVVELPVQQKLHVLINLKKKVFKILIINAIHKNNSIVIG